MSWRFSLGSTCFPKYIVTCASVLKSFLKYLESLVWTGSFSFCNSFLLLFYFDILLATFNKHLQWPAMVLVQQHSVRLVRLPCFMETLKFRETYFSLNKQVAEPESVELCLSRMPSFPPFFTLPTPFLFCCCCDVLTLIISVSSWWRPLLVIWIPDTWLLNSM